MLHSIEGVIKAGHKAAAGNLKKQIPLLAHEFPEIYGCHPGTINVQLNKQQHFKVISPDYVSKPVDWRCNDDWTIMQAPRYQPEAFSFTRIYFQPAVELKLPLCIHNAWIYGPHQSSHQNEPGLIEIIATKLIEGCVADGHCLIFIDDAKIALTAGQQ